ncbi:MAG: hypothetical protein ACXIUD_02100 [Mongoliitalea sp.]
MKEGKIIMKELTQQELIFINGGEVSFARKAGRWTADFFATTVACAVWVIDCAIDVVTSII